MQVLPLVTGPTFGWNLLDLTHWCLGTNSFSLKYIFQLCDNSLQDRWYARDASVCQTWRIWNKNLGASRGSILPTHDAHVWKQNGISTGIKIIRILQGLRHICCPDFIYFQSIWGFLAQLVACTSDISPVSCQIQVMYLWILMHCLTSLFILKLKLILSIFTKLWIQWSYQGVFVHNFEMI